MSADAFGRCRVHLYSGRSFCCTGFARQRCGIKFDYHHGLRGHFCLLFGGDAFADRQNYRQNLSDFRRNSSAFRNRNFLRTFHQGLSFDGSLGCRDFRSSSFRRQIYSDVLCHGCLRNSFRFSFHSSDNDCPYRNERKRRQTYLLQHNDCGRFYCDELGGRDNGRDECRTSHK